MKCRTCGAKAAVNMRQHKLALCKEHYLEWIPGQTERFIKKYGMFTHAERILVAVSGGRIHSRYGISSGDSVTRLMDSTLVLELMKELVIPPSPSGWPRDLLLCTG